MAFLQRSLLQVLREWKSKRFTGMALIHVHNGVPKIVEYGRPVQIQIEHDEPLEKREIISKDLTTPGR